MYRGSRLAKQGVQARGALGVAIAIVFSSLRRAKQFKIKDNVIHTKYSDDPSCPHIPGFRYRSWRQVHLAPLCPARRTGRGDDASLKFFHRRRPTFVTRLHGGSRRQGITQRGQDERSHLTPSTHNPPTIPAPSPPL